MIKIQTAGAGNLDIAAGSARGAAAVDRAKALEKNGTSSDAEVEKAAGGFEALLLHQMMQSMWETVEFTGMFGEDSNQGEIYRDMFNQALSDSVAEGKGIGVKEFIRNELLKDSKASKTQGIA